MPNTIDAIIDRQLRRWEVERSIATGPGQSSETRLFPHPLITVSRQHASGGAEIAARLADAFRYTLLYRDVIDRMCESTGIARRLFEALDEHARSQIDTWCEAMVAGRYVDASDYVQALLKIIFSIAQLGGVVVVGRGANFILGPSRGFHVRVVAPREVRVRRLMERRDIGERAASHELDQVDHDRAEFVRRVFGRSVDDPLGYDTVLNVGDASPESFDAMLAVAARGKFARLREAARSHA